MTISRPSVTPRAGVLIPFIILSDSDDEDDSTGDELTETAESLSTQTASTSVIYPPTITLAIIIFTTTITFAIVIFTTTITFAIITRKRPISPSPPPRPSVSPPPPSAILPPPPEVVVLEVTATSTLVRLHRMVEARRWTFAMDSIDVWRYQEGELRYKIGKSSSAQIRPITGEPIHRTIPLPVVRLVRHDGQIEGIRDHLREISVARSEFDERIETLEQEVETLCGRADYSEAWLQQCEADMRKLRAHIRRLEDHSGM
ncbi:hypothetical protein Tco_0012581 [Tanacetum coccineum]